MMPKLLKNRMVQLHMPRTGGRSLAEQIGVKKLVGTMHDGAEQIPERWRHLRTISTMRPPVQWYRSMHNYLASKKHLEKHLPAFECYPSMRVIKNSDPKFGLWEDSGQFKDFVLNGRFYSWYEAYVQYFIEPADIVVKTENLKVHIGDK